MTGTYKKQAQLEMGKNTKTPAAPNYNLMFEPLAGTKTVIQMGDVHGNPNAIFERLFDVGIILNHPASGNKYYDPRLPNGINIRFYKK